MSDFNIKQGDRLPAFEVELTEAGIPSDITTASGVSFHFRKQGTATSRSGSMNVINASGGVVSYPWRSGDTDIAGDYDAEVVVTYSGGLESTYPTDPDEPYFEFTILEGL